MEVKLLLLLVMVLYTAETSRGFFFDDLLDASDSGYLGNTIPNTGSDIENILFRSCYVCHGTSVSSVTSSCWETVNEEHKRFVTVQSCFGACSITVLNHTSIGLIDYTRRCEPECTPDCHQTDQNTQLCKHCCYGDRCNGVLPTHVPKGPETLNEVSKTNLQSFLDGPMAKPRHHSVNPSNKIAARKKIVNLLRHFGLPSEMQEFRIAQTVVEDKSPLNYRSYIKTVIKGYNIIATIRGRHYGTINDEMIVLMANYDTHSNGAAGTDDNASGVTALLEIARLLMRNETCERHYSVVLVATDFNEQGSYWDGLSGNNYTNCVVGDQYVGLTGSSHFLCGYLLPHLRRTGSRAMLAVNLHSLLNYDSSPASQSLPDLRDFITGHSRYSNEHYRRFEKQVSKRKYVGDWMLASYAHVEYNSKTTQFYINKLETKWESLTSFPLPVALITQHIPIDGHEVEVMQVDDCLPFSRLRHPLPCISLTDTGPLRGYMRGCHHSACDDSSHITDENLNFLAKVTTVVWQLVDLLSENRCLHQPSGFTTVSPTTIPLTTSTVHSRSRVRDRGQSRRKSCGGSLFQSSQSTNDRVTITATCSYSRDSLELCEPPNSGLWALVNSGTAWIPQRGKKKRNRRLWFQIDLGRRSNITKVSLQGVRGQGFVRSFMLSHSNNGSTWNWHIPISPLPKTATALKGSTSMKKVATRVLNPHVLARYIRIHPRKWRRRIALRIELFGCAA